MAIPLLLCAYYKGVVYGSPPDTIIIFLSAVALVAYRRLPPLWATVALGAIAGLASGVKLHGFLYIMPFALSTLHAQCGAAARLKLFAVGAAAALAFFALPFAVANIHFADYLAYIRLASKHGLSLDTIYLLPTASLAVLFLLPLLVLFRPSRGVSQEPDRWFLASYGGAVLISAVLSHKPGAGAHHLLPLLPAFAVVAVSAIDKWLHRAGREDRFGAVFGIVSLIFAFSYGPQILVQEFLRELRNTHADAAISAEADTLFSQYPGALMGIGDRPSLHYSVYGVYAALRGTPPRLEYAAWLDLKAAGVSADFPVKLLRDCAVRHWVVPKGSPPFSLGSDYTPDPLFSDGFRALFFRNYRIVRQGDYFDVWSCHVS